MPSLDNAKWLGIYIFTRKLAYKDIEPTTIQNKFLLKDSSVTCNILPPKFITSIWTVIAVTIKQTKRGLFNRP